MPLINCNVELKFKWMKNCVLSVLGKENADANSHIIFTLKDTTLHVPIVTLTAKDNQKLSKLFGKEFERSMY